MSSRRRKRKIPIPSFTEQVSSLLSTDDADANDDISKSNSSNIAGSSSAKGVTSNTNGNVNNKRGGSKRLKKNEENAAAIPATTSTSSRNSNRNRTTSASASASNRNNKSETTEAISYLSSILKIETAMQLQQRRSTSTSTHAITSACVSISMDKFIQIISKAMDVAGTHSMAMQLAAIYITIAQPALIQIQFTNRNNTGTDTNTRTDTRTDETVSKLVKIDFTIQNRIQLLTQLYQSRWKQHKMHLNHDEFLFTLQQVSKMYSMCKQKDDPKGKRNRDANDILRLWTDPPAGAGNDNAVTTLHQSTLTNSDANTNTNTNTSTNLSTMTLEQRIRAREEAKRVANAKETIVSRQSSDIKQYAHLLPLADALNILLKRKNRAGAGAGAGAGAASANANAGSMARCTWRPMPLKDVCKQLSGRSIRGELNFRGMERMNSKDIKSLIAELVDAVPEWVHIVGGGGGGTSSTSKSKPMSKSNKGMLPKGVKMVVIQNGTNYQTVREKLSGRVWKNVEESSTAVVNKKEEPARLDSNSNSSQGNEAKATGGVTFTIKSPKKPINTKKRKNTSDFVQMAEKQEPPARKVNKLSLSKRGNRIPIPGNSFTNSDGMIPSLAHAGSNLEQVFSFGDSSDDQDHERNQSRSGDVKGEASAGLRVNHNQHMTDADFSGGQILHSDSTNPRGLKLMFGQLNAGERI